MIELEKRFDDMILM